MTIISHDAEGKGATTMYMLDGERSGFFSRMAAWRSSMRECDAFYCVCLSDIVERYERWCRQLPNIRPYYAVKCNSDPIILRLLKGLGCGFDCASKGELREVLRLGVDVARDVIYANPCKQASHIRYAVAQTQGTENLMMTFDNDMELHKIKALSPQARLVLRIAVDDSSSQCQLSMKYGCEVGRESQQLLQLAKDLDLDVVGVSFHCGSGCGDASKYGEAVCDSRRVFEQARAVGYHLYLLDIGGGFPGHDDLYHSLHMPHTPTFEQISEVVVRSVRDYFSDYTQVATHTPSPDHTHKQLVVIAEPGRYFLTQSHSLLCNVIAKRRVVDAEGEPRPMYYINDGVYGSFNCLLYDHSSVDAKVVGEPGSKSQVYESSVWGPTCDGLDCVLACCALPDLDIGRWLVFDNMGAYTKSAAGTFNGFPVPSVLYYTNITNSDVVKDTLGHQGTMMQLVKELPVCSPVVDEEDVGVALDASFTTPPHAGNSDADDGGNTDDNDDNDDDDDYHISNMFLSVFKESDLCPVLTELVSVS